MPARNIYHDTVVQALTADGWTITDDPLRLSTQPVAEELVAAGIPREDIVLGFHPARVRQHTGFAVS